MGGRQSGVSSRRSRQFSVDQPALNIGVALRRISRWGWRSWRHEVRAPHGRPVSIVPRLPRDERVRSKFLRPRLYAADSSLPFFSFFSFFSLSLFFFPLCLSLSPFSFCRSFTRTRSHPRRSPACDASLLASLRYIVHRSRPRVLYDTLEI